VIVNSDLINLVKPHIPRLASFMEYMMLKAAFRSRKPGVQPVEVLLYQWMDHLYYLDIHYKNKPFKGNESPANIRAMFVLNMKEDELGSWMDGYFGMCRDRYWRKVISNYFRHHDMVMTPEQRLNQCVCHSIFGPKLIEMFTIRDVVEVEVAQ
jgi:hypothetical protein